MTDTGIRNLVAGGGTHIEIIGNDIHGGFYGMYAAGENWLIEGNNIHDNIGSYGIHLYHTSGGVNNNIIRNNDVHHNGGHDYRGMGGGGIVISKGLNNVAENNHVHDNFGGGIDVSYGCDTCVVANNTVTNNTRGGGVNLIQVSNTIVKDNLLSGNAGEILDYDGGAGNPTLTGNGPSGAGADMSKIGTAASCSDPSSGTGGGSSSGGSSANVSSSGSGS